MQMRLLFYPVSNPHICGRRTEFHEFLGCKMDGKTHQNRHLLMYRRDVRGHSFSLNAQFWTIARKANREPMFPTAWCMLAQTASVILSYESRMMSLCHVRCSILLKFSKWPSKNRLRKISGGYREMVLSLSSV